NGAGFDPGHVLRSSLDTLDEAVRAARSAESANDPVQAEEALQQLTASYLAVRNALPLTSVDTGAPANSRGEGGHRQYLDQTEAATRLTARDRSRLRDAFAGMLDTGALDFLAGDSTAGPVASFAGPVTPGPGPSTAATGSGRPQRRVPRANYAENEFDPQRVDRMVAALHVFVDTARTAWPRAAQAAGLATEAALREVLESADMEPAELTEVVTRTLTSLTANPVRDTSRPGQPADVTVGSGHAHPGGDASASPMDLDPGRPPQPVPATTPHQATPHQATQDPTSQHPATPHQVAPDRVTQDPTSQHPATSDRRVPDQVRQTPVAQNPALQDPGPGLAVPERPPTDRSWEFSTAHTAGWSRPEVKIGEHDWRPVLAGAQPSTVQTSREEPLVTRGRVLQRVLDGDGLPGFARERTTIGFDVAELHTPAGPVRAYRVRLHINGDGTMDPATQGVINGVKRAAQDGVGQYLNQGYRLPGGEQFHVDVEFVGADQHSHPDITALAA